MKVILLKDINKLGKKNSVVNVKDGYALNFLIPQKMAVPASKEKIKQLEANQQKTISKQKAAERELKKLMSNLSGQKIIIKKPASDKGKLFASLTLDEILSAIKNALGIELDKSQIKLKEHIKTVGEHKIKLIIKNKTIELTIKVSGS